MKSFDEFWPLIKILLGPAPLVFVEAGTTPANGAETETDLASLKNPRRIQKLEVAKMGCEFKVGIPNTCYKPLQKKLC